MVTAADIHEALARNETLVKNKSGLRDAMRQLASGVSVITTGLEPQRTGFTATSVSSLSLDPPRVIVLVNRTSSSFEVLRESGVFGVNILTSNQLETANRFAGIGGVKGEARYSGASWTVLKTGASLLRNALAAIDCSVEEIIERHSHAIIIGTVEGVLTEGHGAVLSYWRGQYDRFEPARTLAAE